MITVLNAKYGSGMAIESVAFFKSSLLQDQGLLEHFCDQLATETSAKKRAGEKTYPNEKIEFKRDSSSPLPKN